MRSGERRQRAGFARLVAQKRQRRSCAPPLQWLWRPVLTVLPRCVAARGRRRACWLGARNGKESCPLVQAADEYFFRVRLGCFQKHPAGSLSHPADPVGASGELGLWTAPSSCSRERWRGAEPRGWEDLHTTSHKHIHTPPHPPAKQQTNPPMTTAPHTGRRRAGD